MIGKLTGFVFFGILLALAYHLTAALIYEHFFAASRLFQAYWYVPLVAVPALLLGALARALGLLCRGATRGANAAALAILAAIMFLTVGAPYSCWAGCF